MLRSQPQPRIKLKPTLEEKRQIIRVARREKVQQFGNELGITKLDDWYKITYKLVVEKGGENLLLPYGRSLYRLLQDVYPSHNWEPWKFAELPRKSLTNPEIRKNYITWVGSQLGIKKLDDWYKITTSDLQKTHALKKVYKHYPSLHEALQEAYPEHRWMPWFFQKTPKGFFADSKNQRQFFDWLATQLNIKHMDDWYTVTSDKVAKYGGGRLLCIHGWSLFTALSNVYPEHDWKIWKFASTPKNTWTQERAVQFIQELSDKLEIAQLDDWYRVSRTQLAELSAISLIQHYGSLYDVLKAVYPDHPWQPQQFRSKTKKSAQRWLKVVLTKLFPNEEIYEDYQHPDVALGSTPLQLDVFLPKLRLAFEYQGEQHYQDLFFFGPQARYQYRDNYKMEKCKENNLTIIEVPYWWDRKDASLAATIQQHRPDVKLNIQGKIALAPIPESPPKKSQKSVTGSHSGFPLMIASDWKSNMDVTGWLMSEKYDGIRAYWRCSDKVLFSRNGVAFKAPSFWLQDFPLECDLDGELWCEDGYNDLAEILSSKKEDLWTRIKFQAFDSVTPNSSSEAYQSRYDRLVRMQQEKKLPKNVQVVEHTVCKGNQDMKKYLESILSKGGEGVILRDPNSGYLPEKSPKFLKAKPVSDTEVTFLQVKEENGFLGLSCEQSNGVICFVRSDAEIISNPPAAGTLITVRYSGLWKNGRLKNPFFYRIASDKSI